MRFCGCCATSVPSTVLSVSADSWSLEMREASIATLLSIVSMSMPLSAASCCCLRTRLQVEYHRFFTELSLRPGSDFAISAHRVPSFACILRMIWSSSVVQAPFFSEGSRLLHQRSRHCLPVRPKRRWYARHKARARHFGGFRHGVEPPSALHGDANPISPLRSTQIALTNSPIIPTLPTPSNNKRLNKDLTSNRTAPGSILAMRAQCFPPY